MKYSTRLAAALATLALAVAACGGGNDASTGGGATTTPGGGTQFKDLSGQSIEVAGAWGGSEQKSFTAVLDDFHAKTKATVKYTSFGDNLQAVLGPRVKGGNPPDIGFMPNVGILQQFVKEGSLKPLAADVTTELDKNFSPVWKTLGTVDGKAYGVAYKGANKSTVWYRTAAFDQAGVSEPKTWDDFTKALQTLSDSGVANPLSVGGGDAWTLTDWFENVYIRVAGPDKYDQLSTHKIKWTDDSVKQALTILSQLWGKQNLIVGGSSGALQTLFPQSVTNVFGDNPKGAVVYEGDFVATNIAQETKSKVGTDAKFFDFPSINGSPTAVVGGADIAVAFKDNPASQEFLKYLATPDAAAIWAKLGGFTSPNKNLDASNYSDETTRKSAQALVGAGDAFRFDMSDLAPAAFGGTPGSGEWKILQDFLAKPSDVDGTAQKLETAAAAAFK
ncbi:MAG: alpha-glucoside transport system substrate-binding protein [Mycobacteriales bacterium]|jgi:ABC-type glycerol-3-phosphate transport system substrate-binding protein